MPATPEVLVNARAVFLDLGKRDTKRKVEVKGWRHGSVIESTGPLAEDLG